MVFGRIRDYIQGEPTLPPGPIRLPDYFPVEPIGCEKKTQALFQCLSTDATQKQRELEKSGKYRMYDENEKKNVEPVVGGAHNPDLDPLEPCRSLVAHYKRCCDRELKRRKNWRLTETYRVQEEYRYNKES